MHDELTLVDLRTRLADLAGEVAPGRDPAPDVLAGAGGVRRRRFLLGGAALAAAAVTGTAGGAYLLRRPNVPVVPADGPFLGWETLGDAHGDIVETAVDAWRQHAGEHTGIRVYAAVDGTPLGRIAIIGGWNTQGLPRLAFLTGTADDPGDSRVWLRADRPAPDPEHTPVVSLVTPRVGPAVGELATAVRSTPLPSDPLRHLTRPALVPVFTVALAIPGVEHVRTYSTTIDHVYEDGAGGPKSRLEIKSGGPDDTALTTTVTGYIAGSEVFRVPAQHGIGDPEPVAGKIKQRHRDRWVVEMPSEKTEHVRPAQVVATPDGLVGRVVEVRRGRVVVHPLTAAGFTARAWTAISDNHGGLVTDQGGVWFDGGPARNGNRIVTADPAQGDAATGAVTVGRVAEEPRRSGAVRVEPAVRLDQVETVHVLMRPR